MEIWFLHEFDDRYNPPRDNGYWEIGEDKPEIGDFIKLYNSCGGFHNHLITEKDELIQSTWEEILYKYYHDNQTSPYGWIDREGNFFGCDYMEHKACADACCNLTEIQAEQQGYIKIYSALGELEYYCDGRMTVAQKNTLESRGFIVDECEVNWNE